MAHTREPSPSPRPVPWPEPSAGDDARGELDDHPTLDFDLTEADTTDVDVVAPRDDLDDAFDAIVTTSVADRTAPMPLFAHLALRPPALPPSLEPRDVPAPLSPASAAKGTTPPGVRIPAPPPPRLAPASAETAAARARATARWRAPVTEATQLVRPLTWSAPRAPSRRRWRVVAWTGGVLVTLGVAVGWWLLVAPSR